MNSPAPRYVVAFNRDRDFYELPLALEEHGLLERLVTDIYSPETGPWAALPGFDRLRQRYAKGLPSARVDWNCAALFWQVVGKRIGLDQSGIFLKVNRALSLAALAVARRTGADLFLYSGYAAPAFTHPSMRDRRKGLFVYHPLSAFNRDILEKDFALHPECAWSMATEMDTSASAALCAAENIEWSQADFIVCASGFSRRSLLHAGCAPEKISVVPYGYDSAMVPFDPVSRSGDACNFLFVGQGVQRKGLHHLFSAWRDAALAPARLSVIASALDPGIAARASPDVTILPAQPRALLLDHFRRADVFVMPSLIEGFGFVYLEALCAGCFVIGTPNTGLPDIDPPSWAVKLVPPGNNDALVAALTEARDAKRDGRIDPARIRAYAESITWPKFREDIAAIAARGLAR